MKCRYDYVIYEGKEYRALEIIKKLRIPNRTYYRQREKGMTSQEAFLYCLHSKQRITVVKAIKETKISKKTIYKGLHNNMSLDEIKKAKQNKEAKEFQTLEYLRQIGLPLEYNSLTDFCNRESLNMVRIYKGIQKGMNLYDATQNSLTLYTKKKIKYIYNGVSLRALAQKYTLDVNRLNFWLRKGYSYLEAIEKEVFARTFTSFENIMKRFTYLWEIYKNEFLKSLDIQTKVTDKELQAFISIYSRMEHIKRDLFYYAFLETIDVTRYRFFDLDFCVQQVLLNNEKLPFTLSELYYILDFENGLMKDFTFLEEQQVWVYNGNREVLKKLKKPSN